jgi:hypothetical protein
MKFLLFFISLLFSMIFYIFYNLSIWKDILWNDISNSVELLSISNNLLIESFVFFFIWIIFLYNFSSFSKKADIKKTNESKILNYKYEILYFLFYSIFIFILYFYNFRVDSILFLSIILFISSDLLFNHISNSKIFIRNKVNIRVIGLILNYFSSIISVFYILNNENIIISFLILLFNIIFNILIHKKYTNYISLLISILSIGFLFYILYLNLFELYILYI